MDDPTLAEQRLLARALKLVWRVRTNRGLFLRAEDFFNFQQQLKREQADFPGHLERMDEEYADRSDYAKTLAMGPLKASLADMGDAMAPTRTRDHMAKRFSASSRIVWYPQSCICSTSQSGPCHRSGS